MPVIDLSDGGAATPGAARPSLASLRGAPLRPLEDRIVAATLRCVGRWGVAKTTLDDIARDAGCSRATVYRVFPGGKDTVMLATARHEMAAVLDGIDRAIAGSDSLEDLLAVALCRGIGAVRGHQALQYLAQHEPGIILPWVSFDGLDPILAFVTEFLAPHTSRFLPAREAAEVAEAVVRLVISHAFESVDAAGIDLARPDEARRFVATYLLPGYQVSADLAAG